MEEKPTHHVAQLRILTSHASLANSGLWTTARCSAVDWVHPHRDAFLLSWLLLLHPSGKHFEHELSLYVSTSADAGLMEELGFFWHKTRLSTKTGGKIFQKWTEVESTVQGREKIKLFKNKDHWELTEMWRQMKHSASHWNNFGVAINSLQFNIWAWCIGVKETP